MKRCVVSNIEEVNGNIVIFFGSPEDWDKAQKLLPVIKVW
jgi:hypothetical protein